VVGFWGMRFPTDRVAPANPAATSGVTAPPAAKASPAGPTPVAASPVAPKAVEPTTVPAPKPAEVRPTVVTTPSPLRQPAVVAPPQQQVVAAKPATPVTKAPEAPTAAPTIAASLASSVASLLGSPEVPPAATPKPPAAHTVHSHPPTAAHAGDASTEELKQQAARLQEQLSSMLFGANPTATPKPPAPAVSQPASETKPAASLTSKVLEMAKPEPLAPPKLSPVSKATVPPAKSSLDTEEVKIPSWLEPLARNAAAPTTTQELIEREKARQAAELREHEEMKPEPVAADPVASAPVSTPEPELPTIGNLLPLEGESQGQPAEKKSKGGMWIGVAAAAILAVAGGGWYFLHQTTAEKGGNLGGGTQSAAVQAQGPITAPASTPTHAAEVTSSSASRSAAAASQPAERPAISEPLANAPAGTPALKAQPAPVGRDTRGAGTAIPAASTERIARTAPAEAAPSKPEPKKPSLGEVHLASPTLNHAAAGGDDGAAPTISSDAASATPGMELVPGASNQPAAPKMPLPIGGDVKPAKLLASTPPMYPSMAKTQHITGDVTIDALVDTNGKVTTMKVVSGPTLLRQAAMDAVRQWKYQAATLDGKAVAMHLNVTVQFRMQ
jgi:TonB family protein